MKTLGLIGGIGPESTIEYYRLIIAGYREKSPDASYPSIVINSLNLTHLLDLLNSNRLDDFTSEFAVEIERLAKVGADFAALAANTPHLVFDELRERSTIPLIGIVESTCERVQELGFKTVGLMGTRFTMGGDFYPKGFSRVGISMVVPDKSQQDYIHEKYIGELLNNVFLPETRAGVLAIADELKAKHGVEALVLAGTELPLLLRDEKHNGMPLLDTSRIHIDRILKELLA